MIVYHGSDHIIETPLYNGSKRTNDYGYGFYTTVNKELAMEQACGDNRDGFANIYELNTDGLEILNLNDLQYNILNWLAVLTKYRSYWQSGSIAEEAKNYLQKDLVRMIRIAFPNRNSLGDGVLLFREINASDFKLDVNASEFRVQIPEKRYTHSSRAVHP